MPSRPTYRPMDSLGMNLKKLVEAIIRRLRCICSAHPRLGGENVGLRNDIAIHDSPFGSVNGCRHECPWIAKLYPNCSRLWDPVSSFIPRTSVPALTCLPFVVQGGEGQPPIGYLVSFELVFRVRKAIAMALAVLQQDNWVGEIGQGFTTVSVLVQQPPVKHEVKMKDFVSWLGRQGRSPAEVMLKQKLEKILGKANHART